jgi:hypothetical protein
MQHIGIRNLKLILSLTRYIISIDISYHRRGLAPTPLLSILTPPFSADLRRPMCVDIYVTSTDSRVLQEEQNGLSNPGAQQRVNGFLFARSENTRINRFDSECRYTQKRIYWHVPRELTTQITYSIASLCDSTQCWATVTYDVDAAGISQEDVHTQTQQHHSVISQSSVDR